MNFLPNYAAVASYYKVLTHQPSTLEPFVDEARKFSADDRAKRP